MKTMLVEIGPAWSISYTATKLPVASICMMNMFSDSMVNRPMIMREMMLTLRETSMAMALTTAIGASYSSRQEV